MNSQHFAASVNRRIDEDIARQPKGTREGHTLVTLARRLLVPPETAQDFINQGILRPAGHVIRGDHTRLSFFSNELNAVRRAVLLSVVEGVVERADSAREVEFAVTGAMSGHVKTFSAQPSKQLNFASRYDGVYRYTEDDESLPRKAAATAGAVGAAYVGASYLRGRAPGLSPIQAVRAGHRANSNDIRKTAALVRPGVAKVASATGDILAGMSAAAKRAGASVLNPRMRR